MNHLIPISAALIVGAYWLGRYVGRYEATPRVVKWDAAQPPQADGLMTEIDFDAPPPWLDDPGRYPRRNGQG